MFLQMHCPFLSVCLVYTVMTRYQESQATNNKHTSYYISLRSLYLLSVLSANNSKPVTHLKSQDGSSKAMCPIRVKSQQS